MNTARWRLFRGSVPVAVLVLIARYVVQDVFDVKDIITFGEVGAVITGATLIIGFMLAGVIADYKEAEKLPAVVGNALSGLAGLAEAGLAVKDKESSRVRARVHGNAQVVLGWFIGKSTDEDLRRADADISQMIVDLERDGVGSHYLSRLLLVHGEMKATLGRISVIRGTSFIQSGYVLMTFLVVILMALLVVVEFPSTAMSWIAPAALGVAYSYLLLLVKDVDNPFGHAENDGAGSGADVDISPIERAVALLSR
jgi:hypothetical protein